MPYNDISLFDRLRSDSSGTPMAAMVDLFRENVFASSEGKTEYDWQHNQIYISAYSASPLADFIHEYAHSLTDSEHRAVIDAIVANGNISDVQAQQALATEIGRNEARAEALAIYLLGQAGFLNTLGIGSAYIGIGQAIQLYNDCKAQSGFVPNTGTGAATMMACLIAGVKATLPPVEQLKEYSTYLADWRRARGMSTTPPTSGGGAGSGGGAEPTPIAPSPAPVNPLPPAPPIKEVNVTDPAPIPPPPPPSGGGGGGGGGHKPGDDDLQPMRGGGDSSTLDEADPALARRVAPATALAAPPRPVWVDSGAAQLVSAMAAFAPQGASLSSAATQDVRAPMLLATAAA